MSKPSRIGTFLTAVFRSCYDMEWYRAVRTRPWTKALSYVAVFQLLLTVAMTAVFAPALFMAQTSFMAHVSATFPADAKVRVANGQMSTNLVEPFEAGVKGMRVTFDTAVTGSSLPERYEGHDGMLIGLDAAFIRESDSERRTYLMAEFPDFEMTKTEVLGWVGTWGMLAVFGFLLIFATTFFLLSLAGSILYVAVTAAIASMAGTLWGVKIGYSAWFAVGLHAVTLPTLVNLASNTFGLRIPFAFTFIYFMFIFSVIVDERALPTLKPETPPAPPAERPAPDAEPPAGPRARAATRKIAAKPAPKRAERKKPAPKQ